MSRFVHIRTTVAGLGVTIACVLSPVSAGPAHASAYGPEVFSIQTTDVGQSIVRAPAADPTKTTTVYAPGVENDLFIDQVEVSPLGGRVAAVIDNEDDLTETLVVMDRDGRNEHTLVSFGFDNSGITESFGFDWAPDGRSIVYGKLAIAFTDEVAGESTLRQERARPWAARPGDDVSTSLRRVSTVGAAHSTAIKGGRGLAMPAVSPSGKQIAAFRYDFASVSGAATLVRLTPATGAVSAPLVTLAEDAVAPAYSPDGTHIAYEQDTTDYTQADSTPTGDIDVILADGSSNGVPAVVASGAASALDEDPAWESTSTVWFDRQTFPPVDSDTETYGDIYSVALPSGGTQPSPVDRTNTPTISESGTSFGPASDTGTPARVTFRSFLLGKATTVRWSNPSDPEFSHVEVSRDGQHVYTGPAESFVDKGTVVGHHYTYSIRSYNGTDVPGGRVSKAVVATADPPLVLGHPTSAHSRQRPFRVSWRVHNPKGTTYDVQWAAVRVLHHRLATTGREHAWRRHTRHTTAVFGAHGSPARPRPGETYVLRVRSHDSHGNSSAWSTQTQAVLPVDQGAAHRHGRWSTVGNTHAWLHSYTRTSTDLSSLTFPVVGSGARVLVDECPSCGSFDVYQGSAYGGKYLGSYGTHAGTNRWRRQLVNVSFADIGKHTLRVVAHLSAGQQLRVDGLVVFERNPKHHHGLGGGGSVGVLDKRAD